ncbi:hypothetical protein, partial [Enterococcus faecalis]|uniref:hypothetical protein n=1 Tax=Enterococcus faecalis TaxID=1351 RepID=UPI00403F6A1F
TVFVDGLSPYNGDAYVSYDGITFVEDYGDEYIEFHTQPQAILGVFNRQTSNVSFFLPGPNTTRAVDPIYKLDGYWAYSTQKFDQPT